MKRSYYKKRGRGKKSQLVTKKQMYSAIHRNVENKFISGALTTSFASVNNTWDEQVLSTVAQGTDQDERIGNHIRLRSLEIKGVIAQGSADSSSDDPYNVMRIVIGLWGSSTTPLGNVAWGINVPLRKNMNPGELFKKYYDKYVALTVTSTEKGEGDGYTPGLKQFHYYKKFKNVVINWGSSATTEPDKRMILSIVSDSAAVPNPGFINGYWVLTYEDA